MQRAWFARPQGGLTLVELMLAIALVVITVSIALPVYQDYVSEARIHHAVQDIRKIELMIEDHKHSSDGALPASLVEIAAHTITDPWGNSYRYLNIAISPPGNVRKDKSLVPVNSDYDLYSMGPDGATTPAFTANNARDDIVRCADGSFVGVAGDY